jgi:hypothetical protein
MNNRDPTFNSEIMKLAITEDRQISEVQEDFNRFYPFLKIEFFRNHNAGQPQRVLTPGLKLGDITYSMHEGSIQLSDNMTVCELEDVFKDRFGLEVHVLRRCGNVWMETTMTDCWTLQNQNHHGCEIAGHAC